MINPTDYCNGSVGLWDDWNDNDKHTLSQPLYGVHSGNSPQVRALFNVQFNKCIQYHAQLWRDRPHNERGFEYYCERYARLYEDLFRLCELFPDLPELNNEYWKFINLHQYYVNAGEQFRNRAELRQRQEWEKRLQPLRELQRAHKEKYPNGKPPVTCPRCLHKSYYITHVGLEWDEYECKLCGYPNR